QRVDLECAAKSALDACGLRKMRNVLAAEEDASCARSQRASHQIHKRRLACTVWSDQSVACATFETEIDVTGDRERSKPFVQALCLKVECAHLRAPCHCFSRARRPSMPPRAKITTKIMKSPIQKYQ